MIRFDDEFGIAFITEDNIEENGWIFTYDPIKHKFLIWSNVEFQIMEGKPEKEVNTLEEVLDTIKTFT